ncbi:MAG: cyclic-di-AMP receptor [Peptococcaceae bacterium]
MKLILAVVQDTDAPALLEKLVEGGYRATKLASTGGFLKKGNTTIFAGVEDERVQDIIELIKNKCCMGQQLITPIASAGGPMESYLPHLVDIPTSGANIFVIDVAQYVRV